jgi:hypothetical protein
MKRQVYPLARPGYHVPGGGGVRRARRNCSITVGAMRLSKLGQSAGSLITLGKIRLAPSDYTSRPKKR